MGRAKGGSKKIKKQPETPAMRQARAVAAKGEALGVPAAQIARGGHVEVRVPLNDGGRVTTLTTLLNRGGTAVARWHRTGEITDIQLGAIEYVQGLWERAATVPGLVFDPMKVPGGAGGDGLAQHQALSDLHDLRGRIPHRYWSVFENVCRWDEPAGTAGSALATNSRSALTSARICVCFVADLIAMWRGMSC